MEANRALTRLGFHCCRTGHRPDGADQDDLSPPTAACPALEAALAVAQEAVAGLANRVAKLEQLGES
jgi:hypothetical protein